MRAIVCHRLSDDRSGLRYEDAWPEPNAPQAGEVTIAVAHAALNFPDLLMLAGQYQFAPPLPFIPGLEGAGTIRAVGPGVDLDLLGRDVIVGARCGMFAERITVSTAAIRSRPTVLPSPAAAAFTVTTLTAYVALVRRGRLAAGERVMVAGAGSGTGLAAVALASALGATVIALASTPAKLLAARDAGANEVVLVPRGATPPPLPKVDIVFDPVGGALTLPLLAALEQGGRYLVVGFVGGIPTVRLDQITQVEVIGVRAGEFARRDPIGGQANLAAIDALAGCLTPFIGLRVHLADTAAALAAMAAGTLIGKALIDCAERRAD